MGMGGGSGGGRKGGFFFFFFSGSEMITAVKQKTRNRRTKDKGQGTEDKETRSRLRLQPTHKAVSPTQGLKAHHSKTTRLPHKLKRAQNKEASSQRQVIKDQKERALKGQREAERDRGKDS